MITIIALAAASTSIGQASDPIQGELASIRQEIAALQTARANHSLSQERAAEIRAAVRDALADADARTSLQGGGATAGYDNGFFMSSADGNFKLKMGVLEQVRYVWQFDNNDTMGFENRRTQLAFGGNMFDPSWTYSVVFNYSPYDTQYGEAANTFNLADAAITKSMDGGLAITAGQFRTPFTRATLVGDGKQLMADYSPTDYNFTAGYQQGIMGSWSSDMFRAMVSIGNGIGATNGTWAGDSNADQFNLAIRAEAKLAGSWSQFAKETSFRGEDFGLLVGVAWMDTDGNGVGNYNGSNDPLFPDFNVNNNAITIDATAFFGGANISAAYTYANETANAGDDSYGLSVQGGLFVTDGIEAWAGWNYIDGKAEPLAPQFEAGNWIQVGANVYFAKNGCKWTTQVNIPINDQYDDALNYGGAWGMTSSPALVPPVPADTSILTQLQFMF